MFTNHQGNMVEYIVVIAAVILLVGAILWNVFTATNGQGANAGTWIDSVDVPAAHP